LANFCTKILFIFLTRILIFNKKNAYQNIDLFAPKFREKFKIMSKIEILGKNLNFGHFLSKHRFVTPKFRYLTQNRILPR